MLYEATEAVYRLITRGDGGNPVFEDDKDRYGWVDLMVKDMRAVWLACVRRWSWSFPRCWMRQRRSGRWRRSGLRRKEGGRRAEGGRELAGEVPF